MAGHAWNGMEAVKLLFS
uniref:Uncharacterized protein n=1 Tax=Arundo donax TaxID=35708 RepID=A0A0A9H6Y9_ARUDO